MRVFDVIRGLWQWTNRSLQRKLIFWSIGFWVISLTIVSLTIFWVGQAEMVNETRQRNVQLASVISREVNAQISSIFSDIRTFSRHLEAISPDLKSQAEAVLALRLSSSQRYRGVYYFDAKGTLLFNLNDPMESLLAVKNGGDIVSRPRATAGKGDGNDGQGQRQVGECRRSALEAAESLRSPGERLKRPTFGRPTRRSGAWRPRRPTSVWPGACRLPGP